MRLSGGEGVQYCYEVNSLTKIGINTFWYYIAGDSPMHRNKRDSQTLTNEIQPGE